MIVADTRWRMASNVMKKMVDGFEMLEAREVHIFADFANGEDKGVGSIGKPVEGPCDFAIFEAEVAFKLLDSSWVRGAIF